MIQIEKHRDGVVLKVRAAPGSRMSGVRGVQDGALKVSVTQVAEKGKANKALVATLSKSLKIRKSQVALLSGETARTKRFLIREMTSEELEQKISQALAKL